MCEITEESHVFLEVPAEDQREIARILLGAAEVADVCAQDPCHLATITGGFRVSRELYDASGLADRDDYPPTDPPPPGGQDAGGDQADAEGTSSGTARATDAGEDGDQGGQETPAESGTPTGETAEGARGGAAVGGAAAPSRGRQATTKNTGKSGRTSGKR